MKELSVLVFVFSLLIYGACGLVSNGFHDSSARDAGINEAIEGAKSLCDHPDTFSVVNISATEKIITFSALNDYGERIEHTISY